MGPGEGFSGKNKSGYIGLERSDKTAPATETDIQRNSDGSPYRGVSDGIPKKNIHQTVTEYAGASQAIFDDKNIVARETPGFPNQKDVEEALERIYPDMGMKDRDVTEEYKYNENRYLEELESYINNTYTQHYSQNRFQATEFIIDSGHGAGFLIGNIMKYGQRYGKKGTIDDHRKDLMKVIHYAMMALYNHDKINEKREG